MSGWMDEWIVRWMDGCSVSLACLSFVPIYLNTSDHFCISRGMCHICISSFQVSSLTKTSKYCLNNFTLICHFPLKLSVSKTTFNNFSWSQVYIYPHDLPALLSWHDPVPTRLWKMESFDTTAFYEAPRLSCVDSNFPLTKFLHLSFHSIVTAPFPI